MEFEERATRAEQARDDAEARKRVLTDTWAQLDSYLVAVSDAAADARAGYSRIVSEGGGQLVVTQIPTMTTRRLHRVSGRTPVLPVMTLPPPNPHVPATGTRRQRTPSMDSYQQQPPSKKARGDGYIGESVRSYLFSQTTC